MATLTPTEQKRLGLIRPELMQDLLQLMDAAKTQLGFTTTIPVDGGSRSLANQTALYNDSIAQGGGTLAYPVGKPGNSRHEYGAAFDLNILAGGSNTDGTGCDNDYEQLAQLAESLPGAPGLIAGYYFAERGEGKSDPYHFQLNESLATSEATWAAMQKAGIVKGAAIASVIVLAALLLRR
jgi:hypothetical protein